MKRILTTAILTLGATPAFAHLSPEQHGSFVAGLSHPMFGLDHILAMLAVGLWAVVLGGRARWALPASFVGVMMLGYVAAVFGYGLPFVEPMILLSVLALGLAVALSVYLPVFAAASIVGAFALFHGHAHGGELGSAAALSFGVGFVLSTALLHGIGVALAVAAGRALTGTQVIRGLGWATTIGGVWVIAAG
ncbi:Hydrogenase/urease accessory protein [Roseovarius mucosus DSM 17069]|uniref:Hydrogenase/urease accessory protein n=1 Tax=Roseovarius mucosus DSM 17069 TaxID=1288298 RepID=A0A0A0HH82_9RHOB|nr:HupE/UreJ family protein [Roseovarius mucosus]KGM86480.1 Hydrogenase/urease accessory protein [Roseovarius mucosus DSM 17069]